MSEEQQLGSIGTPCRSEHVGPPAITRLNLAPCLLTTAVPPTRHAAPVPPTVHTAPSSAHAAPIPFEMHNESRTQPTVAAGSSMEQNLVDPSLENLWSLPEVVSQVAVQHRSHSKEIQVQKDILAQTQAELREEHEHLEDLSQEIQALNRKVISSQGIAAQKKKTVQSLQADISSVTQVKTKLECDLSNMQESLDEFLQTVAKYGHKMSQHESAVEDTDAKNPENEAKHKLKEEIEQLRAQKVAGVETCHKESLLQDVKMTKEKLADTDVALREKRAMLEEKKRKHRALQKETEVLHKRNTAQLTRLKRQLKELQMRQRQWSDEASHLEACISQFKN